MRRDAASSRSGVLGLGADDESFNTQLSFFPRGPASSSPETREGIYRIYEVAWARALRGLSSESKEDGHPGSLMGGGWFSPCPKEESSFRIFDGEERATEGDKWSVPRLDAGWHFLLRLPLGGQRQPRCLRHPARHWLMPETVQPHPGASTI
jgi:hypothetical protein